SDNVVIANAGSLPATLGSAVTVNNLTINASASLSLTSNDLTVSGVFSNEGTLLLNGDEATVSLTVDGNSGLTKFVKNTGAIAVKNFGTYFNVEFASTGDATFQLPAPIIVNGNLSVGSGTTFAPLTHSITLATGKKVTNNGTWTMPTISPVRQAAAP
ncbi:MAG: hypothetical protein PHQ23_04125, partial [Candidatus Wallbacteria bacterium]|nr:hypothetical protein [Candidatus Wallbacteria bacterium]